MSIFTKISGAAAKTCAKASIILAKNGPDILFGVGVLSVVAGTVWAIAVGNKANAVMDRYEGQIQRINNDIETANNQEDPESWYPTAQRKHDKKVVVFHMIKSMAGLYLPVVILEGAGIACLGKSHFTLKSWNKSLTAACAGYATQLSTAKQRTEEFYGKDAVEKIFDGKKEVTYTEKETSENGVTTEVEKTKEVSDPCDIFSFLVSVEDNKWGYKDPHSILNEVLLTLRCLNGYLERRRALPGMKAFITMNEVAEAFGIPQRPEWSTFVIYQDFKKIDGNMITLGISRDNFDKEGTAEWKFLNRITDGIWLTPNIQGNICDDTETQLRIAGLKKIKGEQDGKVLCN